MGIEEIIIKKIEGGIRAIKFGTKTPEEVNLGYSLNKLKDLNPHMYEDKLFEYCKVKAEFDANNGNIS